MLFAIYYEMTPERRDEVLKRFQKFGDARKGMKVVGNWLSVTLLEGWSIVEANDIADLGKLFQYLQPAPSTSITSRRSSTNRRRLRRPVRQKSPAGSPSASRAARNSANVRGTSPCCIGR